VRVKAGQSAWLPGSRPSVLAPTLALVSDFFVPLALLVAVLLFLTLLRRVYARLRGKSLEDLEMKDAPDEWRRASREDRRRVMKVIRRGGMTDSPEDARLTIAWMDWMDRRAKKYRYLGIAVHLYHFILVALFVSVTAFALASGRGLNIYGIGSLLFLAVLAFAYLRVKRFNERLARCRQLNEQLAASTDDISEKTATYGFERADPGGYW
jgi:hypothetical protein